MASYLRIGSVFFATALCISLLAAPARAENAEATLTQASKMLEKGIPVKAIELIDTAIRSGQLPADLSAKALLMRAQAQEKLGKQAFALADYNSALWMQALSATDKAKAEQGRDRISGKLGLAEPAAKPTTSGARANAGENTASRTPTPPANVKSTPSEQRTGGIGSVFSGLFGSTEAAAAQDPQKAKPVTAAKPAAPVKPAAAKPEQVQPAKANAERQPAQIAVAERTSPTAASGEASGKFGIQFAALHSEDGAISEVERIAKKYGSELGGRSPSVKILGTNDGDLRTSQNQKSQLHDRLALTDGPLLSINLP